MSGQIRVVFSSSNTPSPSSSLKETLQVSSVLQCDVVCFTKNSERAVNWISWTRNQSVL